MSELYVLQNMSTTKEHFFEKQIEHADNWICQNATATDIDVDSEEYQQLSQEYWDWQEHLAEEAEHEAELEWLKESGSSEHHKNFISQLEELRKLVTIASIDEQSTMVAKMSYAHAVTLLETFLSDTAKSLIESSDTFFRNAITQINVLKEARYSLSDLASDSTSPKGRAIKELSNLIYHNLPKVRRVLEGILGEQISIDISSLAQSVNTRHDIVHRNGRTKKGEFVKIDRDDCTKLLDDMKTFADSLQLQINNAEQAGAPNPTPAP